MLEHTIANENNVVENTTAAESRIRDVDMAKEMVEFSKNMILDNVRQAIWLIDYWCNKDIKRIIKMPLSRHWIMHIEAANRIKDKLL